MVDTYVPSAEFKNGQIVLTVDVAGFEPGEPVELNGQATQDNGAYAPFYNIKDVPTDGSPLTVEATPEGQYEFDATQVVTVTIRVAKVWVTILKEAASTGSDGGIPKWAAEKAIQLGDYGPAAQQNDLKNLASRPTT
jgi:hypothetical protein